VEAAAGQALPQTERSCLRNSRSSNCQMHQSNRETTASSAIVRADSCRGHPQSAKEEIPRLPFLYSQGSQNLIDVPSPFALVASMCPPWAMTKAFADERPSPVPFALVVK
jgi:hypothetical protein